MIKSWQIFFFSVIPLTLVLTGVILGSVHLDGGDSEAEVFPAPRPQSSAPLPTPIPGASAVNLVAANNLFSPTSRSVTASAGTIQIILYNRDVVVHNVAFYRNAQFTGEQLARTNVSTGPIVESTTWIGATAGTYYFKCEAHPDTMTGSLSVR